MEKRRSTFAGGLPPTSSLSGSNWNSHLSRKAKRCATEDPSVRRSMSVTSGRMFQNWPSQKNSVQKINSVQKVPNASSGTALVADQLAALRSTMEKDCEKACVLLRHHEKAVRELEERFGIQRVNLGDDSDSDGISMIQDTSEVSELPSLQGKLDVFTCSSELQPYHQIWSDIMTSKGNTDVMLHDGTGGNAKCASAKLEANIGSESREAKTLEVDPAEPTQLTEAENTHGGALLPCTLELPRNEPPRCSNMSFGLARAKPGSRLFLKKRITEDTSATRSSMDRTSSFGEHTPMFADLTALKDQVRDAIAQPEHNKASLYKRNNVFTKIITHWMMEQATLCVIAFNTLWLAIEADNNNQPLLFKADVGFLIVEICLCAYFMFEWFVRFMAFETKALGIRDKWFIFDTCLCTVMAIDTIILQLLVFPYALPDTDVTVAASGRGAMGSAQLLKGLRVFRLVRIARMVHVFHAFPELMILAKGIVLAVRSVFFTLVLLGASVYVFALLFRQAADNTTVGDKYFGSVTEAMATLVLRCTIPDLHLFFVDIAHEHAILAMFLSAFILLATFTVMNMLVGVLVEIVKVVSEVEKEGMLVMHVKNTLFSMLEKSGVDKDFNRSLSKHEFHELMMQPQAVRIISSLGVDVLGLVDFSEAIFMDDRELSFLEFMELVLELRGTNTATVKDIVEFRKWMMQEFDDLRICFGFVDSADLNGNEAARIKPMFSSGTASYGNLHSKSIETTASARTASSALPGHMLTASRAGSAGGLQQLLEVHKVQGSGGIDLT